MASTTARAEPTKDECISANESAQNLRQSGNLRAARKQLLVCVAKTCPGPIIDDCTQLLAAVDKAMPTVVFAAKDTDGNDLSAVEVTVDGEALSSKLDGEPTSVDPGEHKFHFESAGFAPNDRTLVIREGEKGRLVPIKFHASSGARKTPGATPATNEAGSTGSPQRWPAYLSFGVGAAGLVVGTVFGVMALSTKSDLSGPGGCKSGMTDCPAQDISNLSTRAWVANAGFAVAILGAGVGTILLLTSGGQKPQHGVSFQARLGPGLFVLGGTLP